MGKKLSLGATIALMAITAAITFSVSYMAAMNKFNATVADVNERQAMYSKLNEIDQTVRQNYSGAIDEEKLKDGICAGYISGLQDSAGQYLSPAKYQEYLSGIQENYVGIGVETVADSDGNMEIVVVFPNSPAQKQGIQKGDIIVKIDDSDVKRIGYAEAVSRLDGDVGSTVALTLLREETKEDDEGKTAVQTQTLVKTIKRSEYEETTVSSHFINGTIGYIRISDFAAATPEEFQTTLSGLQESGIASLVIDVRNNPGTDVEAAAKVLDTLLPAGNLISSVDKDGKETVLYTSDASELGLPMRVLQNDGTYSAAELFASAIKDYKKNTVIGETTAGRGNEEKAVPLSDGSAVIIAVGSYQTPKSGVFTGTGIAPDTEIAMSPEQRELFNRHSLSDTGDPQLQAAVTALGGGAIQSQEETETKEEASSKEEGESKKSGDSGDASKEKSAEE